MSEHDPEDARKPNAGRERRPDPSANSSSMLLTWLILAGLVLGGVTGQLVFRAYGGDVPAGVLEGFYFVGDTFFMNLLKMVLVPLVASSVVVGVASIGDPSRLGRVGGLTVFYYLATMVLAVSLGVLLVSWIQPGDPGGDGSGIGAAVIASGEAQYERTEVETRQRVEEKAEAGRRGVAGALWESFRTIADQLIPSNPIGAAAEGRLLPVIAFSIILGVVLTVVGPAGRALLDVFQALFVVVMKLVSWILWLAPLGVFCLVAWTVARLGAEELLEPLAVYMGTVVLGLALHALVVLPLILWLVRRVNPYRYMHRMRRALMTAFGTDSSSATLPVTLEAAEDEGGVSKETAGFVLPLGATINMDGTALYEAVAVVFLFQAYGISLGPIELVIIVITATLAGMGAAGIPSAGLVTMVIVVEAVNNSLGAGVPALPLAAVGIILGVDRILDMCRTTVNVWGDAVGAKVIDGLRREPPAPAPEPAPREPAAVR